MLDALRELVYLVYNWLLGASAEPGFWSGVLIGVAVLVIFAFLARVQAWWKNVKAPLSPQTITLTTSKTPAQITVDSCTALMVGIAISACIFSLGLEMVYPGVIGQILGVVRLVLREVLRALGPLI